MNLSISNIGWTAENDGDVYGMMRNRGFCGLEIAPTRIIPQQPYDHLPEIGEWFANLKSAHGFVVPSMQSIWFGRAELVFGTAEERTALVDYTKKAVDFAAAIQCRNLVFGNPKNRSIQNPGDEKIALEFFKAIGDYAASRGTTIGMEANPTIYNTNFINDTASAVELIRRVNSKGFMLNLDVGTMIANEESVDVLRGAEGLINHVHISEPFLKPIEHRELHQELAGLLQAANYKGFVSIEMGKVENLEIIDRTMNYVKEIFG